MIHSTLATRGIAVAPHALAAQSALAVLREGGNALEAMIAAAATITVVYPHMNGIGGDSFWVFYAPDKGVSSIDACGAAGRRVTREFYRQQGLTQIPVRGPLAANTVAGTLSGWDLAFRISRDDWGGRLPFGRLLEDAIYYARHGVPVTASQHASTAAKLAELKGQPGFAERFLVAGTPPTVGSRYVQPALAATLERIATAGPRDFYEGDLARVVAADLEAVGSPLTFDDLARHRAVTKPALALKHSLGSLYNMAPPTQGVISLILLGILDRLQIAGLDPLSVDYVHRAVEATKLAFRIRDRYVTDPAYMDVDAQALLDPGALDALAAEVDDQRAAPWGQRTTPGDTVWMGVIDGAGRAVSFIQSIYHEFGSGVVLPGTGIHWQNRGCSFSLDPAALNTLEPGRKPFHTLNPALALLNDGRVMVYGTMGGDGQPQTQAAVFTRYAVMGCELQQAVSMPRWLLGRTWGSHSDTLKLEGRFPARVFDELQRRGHAVERLHSFDEAVGHAGALVRHANGMMEGAFDPRSNGGVAGF
ncbi:MAG: gamma-glutamyltransferase [Azospira oryzae]|nr:MAG: gamma-glutamyltransferase [Azospira oryzae]PZP82698.1 MAG: gamma-glutamyltransferase [Azospira oryzae]